MQILRFYGLKIVDFSEKIGVNSQTVYNLSCGNVKNFSREIMVGIAKNCPEISLFWLITGDGYITIEIHGQNGIVETLVDTIASQQRTIEILVSLLKHD